MFCKNCGTQTENTDALCDNCKVNQPIDPLNSANSWSSQPPNNSTPTTPSPPLMNNGQFISSPMNDAQFNLPPQNGVPFTPPKKKLNVTNIKKAGAIVIISFVISFIFATILSLLLNAVASKALNNLIAKFSYMSFEGLDTKIISPYLMWRMSFLNTPVIRAGMADTSMGLVSVNFHYILLIIIPFISFAISWVLLLNRKVRDSFPFLFNKFENKETPKQVLSISFWVSIAYAAILGLTSFIPIKLIKTENDFFSIQVSYHFSFLSAVVLTFLVVLIGNMLVARLCGIKVLTPIEEKLPTVKLFSNFYTNYLLGATIIAFFALVVAIIKAKLWKQCLLVLTMLPNLILTFMNLLVGGNGSMSSGSSKISLFSTFSKVNKVGFVLLVLVFCIFLLWQFIRSFNKCNKLIPNEYWKQVSTIIGLTMACQLILSFIIPISINTSMESSGRVGISFPLWTTLILIVVIGLIASVIVMYLPKLQSIISNPVIEKRNYWISYAIFTVVSIISILIMTFSSKNSTSVNSILGDSEDSYSYSSIYNPTNVFSYNKGYVFHSKEDFYYSGSNEDLYTYNKGKFTKLTIPSDYSDWYTYFSSTSNRILVKQDNKLNILGNKGALVNKQEITFDNIISTTEDFGLIAFSLDNEVNIYNCKDNTFNIVDAITNVDSGKGYFNEDGTKLYWLDSSLNCFVIKDKSYETISDQVEDFCAINLGNDLHSMLYIKQEGIYQTPDKTSTLTYPISKSDVSYDIVQILNSTGDTPILTNITSAIYIDPKEGLIQVTFDNNSDTYLFDAKSNKLINITADIRYLSSKQKGNGGK